MGKSSGKPVTPLYLKSSMSHLSSLTIAWEKMFQASLTRSTEQISGYPTSETSSDPTGSGSLTPSISPTPTSTSSSQSTPTTMVSILTLGSAYSVKFQTFSLQLAGNIGHQCCKQGRRAGSMTDLLY